MAMVPGEMLFEAAIPLGDATYSRAVKREAVWLVIMDQMSYRAAARKTGISHGAISRWCDEVEERIRVARNWAKEQGVELPAA